MLQALAVWCVVPFGWRGARGPWPKTGSKTGELYGSPRPSESAIRLAAQTVNGVGNGVGVCRAGLSAETRFLAYLLV